MAAAIGDHFAARLAVDRSDGARIDFRDGWAHARPSNTAPVLSLRFEADSEHAYARISEQLIAALEAHPEVWERERIADPPSIGPQPLA